MSNDKNGKLDDIDKKLDTIKDEVVDLRTVVATGFATYNEQLKIHIAATQDNRDEIKSVKQDLVPVQDHVKFMQSLSKFILGLATVASAVFGALKFFGKL